MQAEWVFFRVNKKTLVAVSCASAQTAAAGLTKNQKAAPNAMTAADDICMPRVKHLHRAYANVAAV